MKFVLRDIRTDREGFSRILGLLRFILASPDENLEVDFSHVDWIDANMCAPLGAVLHMAQQTKEVGLTGMTQKLQGILQRNRFLTQFGHPHVADVFETTIQYRRFCRQDRRDFETYISEHFRTGSRGLPTMSPHLLKRFRESLQELYENAVQHSEADLGIFACGQYYPTKNLLDFSIADLGIGIPERIYRAFGKRPDPARALEWVMRGNTTKRGRRPGGLGLKLIREFVDLNQGRIVVVSDAAYWETSPKATLLTGLDWEFGGTVVTIEINTRDQRSYRLRDDIDPNDIF